MQIEKEGRLSAFGFVAETIQTAGVLMDIDLSADRLQNLPIYTSLAPMPHSSNRIYDGLTKSPKYSGGSPSSVISALRHKR